MNPHPHPNPNPNPSTNPDQALAALLSLTLPLFVGCMWVAAEGPADAAAQELSRLAHAAVVALAKRATLEFKQAVSAFDAPTKARVLPLTLTLIPDPNPKP